MTKAQREMLTKGRW